MPPLKKSGGKPARSHTPVITGVVCLHFRRPCEKANDTLDLLASMGKLTAQFLLSSYQNLQRSILLKLDEKAHQYLTTTTRDAEQTCRDYAAEVILIICKNLRVEAVSLFYRDSLRGGIQCLASTGLMWADERPVADLADAHYSVGEGRTGRCYADGILQVLEKGMDKRDTPKTVELIRGKPQIELPAIIYPIPFSEDVKPKNGDPKCLGVIRCKFHYSKQIKGTGLCFDSIEMQTLDFIARQIAPVLETMELNIARERVVSVIKHDLNTPIGTIHHIAFNLRVDKSIRLDNGLIAVSLYDIHDLAVCSMMCLDLVTQLDADPFSFIPAAKPKQISIEAQILAPLKNMLCHYAREEKEMRIRFDHFDKWPSLWLDAVLIHRVLFNLVTNAVKYGKRGTLIDLVGRSDREGYYVDVCNGGAGVPAEDVEKIFVPRFRSANTASSVFGLGLGLSISRACVEKCGCQLFLQNRAEPTIFRIQIPAALSDGPLPKK